MTMFVLAILYRSIENDGSCVYSGCDGCVYEHALNYDEDAKFDDGSCEFEAVSIHPTLTIIRLLTFREMLFARTHQILTSQDSIVSLDDMLEFLIVYSSSAPDFNGQIWAQEACNITPYEDEVLLEEAGFEEGAQKLLAM